MFLNHKECLKSSLDRGNSNFKFNSSETHPCPNPKPNKATSKGSLQKPKASVPTSKLSDDTLPPRIKVSSSIELNELTSEHPNQQYPPVSNKGLCSRPFCDCDPGFCVVCPNILDRLGIRVTETTCEFGPEKPNEAESQLQSKVSGILNLNKDYEYGNVVKALGSPLHMNLGLTHRRRSIEELASLDTTSCVSEVSK